MISRRSPASSRDEPAPLVPVLRPAVDQQQRPALAGLGDVQAHAAGVDEAVLDALDVGEVRHLAASIRLTLPVASPAMTHRSAWLGLLVCGLAAAPADGAAAKTLSVRAPAITAKLRVTAQFAPQPHGRAGARPGPCAAARGRGRRAAVRGRALRPLPAGAGSVAGAGGSRCGWRIRPSRFARVEVRAGRRVLGRATLRRPAALARPPVGGAPPPAPGAPAPAGVSTTPPLVPAYDPAIPDYTVACEPARTVTVVAEGVERTLALSGGQRFTFSAGGRSHSVRCLPRIWTGWKVTRDGHARRSSGCVFNTFAGGAAGYTVIADDRGVPLWWRAGAPPLQDGRMLPDGTIAVGHVSEVSFGRAPYEHVALDGTPRPVLDTVGIVRRPARARGAARTATR